MALRIDILVYVRHGTDQFESNKQSFCFLGTLVRGFAHRPCARLSDTIGWLSFQIVLVQGFLLFLFRALCHVKFESHVAAA